MNWRWGLDGIGLGYSLEEAGIIQVDTWNEEESLGQHREEGEERQRTKEVETNGKAEWEAGYEVVQGMVGLWKETTVPEVLSQCVQGGGHILKGGQAGSGRISWKIEVFWC